MSSDWHEESQPNLSTTSTTILRSNDSDDGVITVEGDSSFNCTLSATFFSASSNYNVVTATICALYFVFGIVCTFFGYRCFKAIMFFIGFIFGSLIVYLICLEENILPMWANTLIAVSAGILFGLITLLVQYVGLFMLGFHSGLLIGIIGLCVVEQWYIPPSPWITVGVLLSCGLVMALCNLCLQKSLTILGSALYGGAIIATGLDYFLENSLMLLWIWDKVRVQESIRPCWFSWAILGAWPIALILGIITQSLVTGKGIYHEQQFPPRKQRGKTETREERKQRKYRYLYQVRTCHGDVISQPISGKYVHQVNESFA